MGTTKAYEAQADNFALPPGIRSAASLKSKVFPPANYVVPDYIAEGLTILAGRPKLGKSWLMLETALATANGGHCLGGIHCVKGDVLYLALEDNERRLQSRITKIVGISNEWPARLHYATEWPRADAGGIDQIRAWIEAAQLPRLVVVDILALFRSPRLSKDSPYESDYAAVHGLQHLASESNIAIVVIHHLRKSGAEAGDAIEKVSGTLGLSGAADTILVLDRDSSGATLYGRGRDIQEIETAVEFDGLTCRWRVLGTASEVRRTDERTAILNALRDGACPLGPTDIAAATGMPNVNVRQLLLKLVAAGDVLKDGRARYRHPSISPTNKHNNITNGEAA